MEFLKTLFGRLHPLLVHLPIGILFLAFLFECLSFRKDYRVLRKAVQPALFWGGIFAVVAAVTGFLLRREGGYDQALADRHQNFGIITAVLAFAVYVLRPKIGSWIVSRRKRRQVKLLLSVPLILCLSITGHWGGALTHGEDYLFAALSLRGDEAKDPAVKIRAITDIEQAVLYSDVIQPILESRCYDCHSAARQKGDLRLDQAKFILKGGENGLVINDGPADSSAIFSHLMLPIEHDDHMPPREKPQPSSSEIALIKYWVEENASFDKTVASLENSEKVAAIIRSLQQPPEKSWIPTDEEVDAIRSATVETLRNAGVNPMPLAEVNNYVAVSFTGNREIADPQIDVLKQINQQLVWLNLSHSGIKDRQLEFIAKLTNLRALYLNNTAVTDEGLSKLASLTNLRWLSLVGTDISDASLATLLQMHNLDNLYLYQTSITRDAIAKLTEANRELRIDTGNYMLKKLPTDTIVYRRTR